MKPRHKSSHPVEEERGWVAGFGSNYAQEISAELRLIIPPPTHTHTQTHLKKPPRSVGEAVSGWGVARRLRETSLGKQAKGL